MVSQIIQWQCGLLICWEGWYRAIFAIHCSLGIFWLTNIFRGANPDFLANELLYQVQATGASIIIAHPESLQIALEVAETAGLLQDRVVLFNAESSMSTYSKSKRDTINDLVEYGLNMKTSFSEKRLNPGEAKTKLAFLSFSSGTTGQPKVKDHQWNLAVSGRWPWI